jgi:DUF971 family protein
MESTPPSTLRPVTLSKDGTERLRIEWNDGHQSFHSWKRLRARCPCANCRDETDRPPDPFRILSATELAPKPPLAPLAMEPVGHYAYKIVWNDGHDSGIYTLENLRELCECPECENRRQSSGADNP